MRLITVALLVFLISCSNSVDDGFNLKELESSDQTQWSKANFKADFRAIKAKYNINNDLPGVLDMLRSFQAQGLNVEIAWFREGSATCNQLQVVVPSQLLIVAQDPEKFASEIDTFEPVKQSPKIFCASDVYQITPS